MRQIVAQHAEDLVMLSNSRQILARSGHVELRRLARTDKRIAAHEDGCVVAGAEGFQMLLERLADPNPSALFAATLVALTSRNVEGLEHCLAVAEAVPECAGAVTAALGWVERDRLAGVVKQLLTSSSPNRRRLGLAACRVHGADPGPMLHDSIRDPDPGIRAEAFRTIGTLGHRQLVSTIAAARDGHPAVQFWATWSAVMLGDRERALDALARIGLGDGPYQSRAFRLVLQASTPAAGKAAVQTISGNPAEIRRTILGIGIIGDPAQVSWLIKHMADDAIARAAGEAFSLITGTDLALLDLERKPPDHIETGPNDEPGDPNVAMDTDDGLPWPDAALCQRWWDANASRFQPGGRYFCGAPVTRPHCMHVLKNGYQRQRILAAHYLCLLEPGTPLFNTSAPAWRQERLLATMG